MAKSDEGDYDVVREIGVCYTDCTYDDVEYSSKVS